MQSCVHAPKCNSEVDKNTDKFVICQGLNVLTKITKIDIRKAWSNEVEGLKPCLF